MKYYYRQAVCGSLLHYALPLLFNYLYHITHVSIYFIRCCTSPMVIVLILFPSHVLFKLLHIGYLYSPHILGIFFYLSLIFIVLPLYIPQRQNRITIYNQERENTLSIFLLSSLLDRRNCFTFSACVKSLQLMRVILTDSGTLGHAQSEGNIRYNVSKCHLQ